MKWTKEKPKECGWYWIRVQNEFEISDNIVEVLSINSEGEPEVTIWDDDCGICPLDSPHDPVVLYWSDKPIPVPEDMEELAEAKEKHHE